MQDITPDPMERKLMALETDTRSFIFSFRNILGVFFVLIFINLIVVDFLLINHIKNQTQYLQNQPISMEYCPQACLDQILLSKQNDTRSVNIPTIQPTDHPINPIVYVPKPNLRELFIPFGSGENSSDDWQDVPGAKAILTAENYPGHPAVTFEAQLFIPNGNQTVSARLFNATDQHPVWYSDVSLEGGTPALVTSRPVTLDPGTKTYQVQMKTTLKAPAVLRMARMHIIIKQ